MKCYTRSSSTTNHAAFALSSTVDTILAMLLAGAPIALATFAAGALRQPTIEEINSSRDGIFETAVTPALSSDFSPIAPPRISNSHSPLQTLQKL